MGGRQGNCAYARQNKRQVGGDDRSTAIMGLEREMVCTTEFPVVDNKGGDVISNVVRQLQAIQDTKGGCRDGEQAHSNPAIENER